MAKFFRKDSEELERGEMDNIQGLTDYNYYVMSKKEKLLYTLIAAAALYVVGYIFYHSHILSAILSLFSLKYPKMRRKQIIEKRKNELNLQFRDMLYSLSSSLSAGKSVEMAFRDVIKDLMIIYPDPNTSIILEVELIVRRIEMNETIESALADFASRSHLEDVENFADVFQTCKRTGGNIVEIIRNTSNIINDKIEIKQEITTLLSSRKFEQKVLNIMPIGLILMLTLTAEDYMNDIFTTIAGRIAMTVAIIFLVAAYFISSKITDIKV